MSSFEIRPGSAVECLSISIQLIKEPVIVDGVQHLYSGFSIAGGIDAGELRSLKNHLSL